MNRKRKSVWDEGGKKDTLDLIRNQVMGHRKDAPTQSVWLFKWSSRSHLQFREMFSRIIYKTDKELSSINYTKRKLAHNHPKHTHWHNTHMWRCTYTHTELLSKSGLLPRGLSEISSSILWCRQTSETKPVSSTWRVRGQVSRCFMVSISSTKPDIEPVGEWGKHWVWLTCYHVSTWTATLSSSWIWAVVQFVQSFSFGLALKSTVTFIFL